MEVLSQSTRISNEKIYNSINTVNLINKSFLEKEKQLKSLSILIKSIYIEHENEHDNEKKFLEFALDNLININKLDITEVSIYKKGLYHYINKKDRGYFSSEFEHPQDIDKVKDMGGYFISTETYLSKTTDLLSMFMMFYIDDDTLIFIEFSIEFMFYYLDTGGDYVFIVNGINENIIYHPDENKIGSVFKAFDSSLYNELEHWIYYKYKGRDKKAHFSNDNPFEWIVIYSIWDDTIPKFIVKELFLFITLILLPFIICFFSVLKEKSNYYEKDNLTSFLRRDSFSVDKVDNSVKAFCFLDIDNFKKINDHYGHDIGDEAIKAFSHCLKENIRDTDVAFRWGGEEFLVIFRGNNEERVDIYTTLERLRSAIEAIEVKGIPSFTVSIGYCDYDRTKNVTSLIKQADIAMYESKRTGRNKVTKYKSFMSNEVL